MPNALARSLASVNITASRDSAAGASSAPNTPCRARAPSIVASPCAAPPTEQQQTAEGEGVGRDDPLPVAVGYAQVLLGGGQSDVHDGRVEHDHQLGERDEDERSPAVGIGGRRLGGGDLVCF